MHTLREQFDSVKGAEISHENMTEEGLKSRLISSDNPCILTFPIASIFRKVNITVRRRETSLYNPPTISDAASLQHLLKPFKDIFKIVLLFKEKLCQCVLGNSIKFVSVWWHPWTSSADANLSVSALLFRKSLMLLNIQKTQHFPMHIFLLLILKPKIYYK